MNNLPILEPAPLCHLNTERLDSAKYSELRPYLKLAADMYGLKLIKLSHVKICMRIVKNWVKYN